MQALFVHFDGRSVSETTLGKERVQFSTLINPLRRNTGVLYAPPRTNIAHNNISLKNSKQHN